MKNLNNLIYKLGDEAIHLNQFFTVRLNENRASANQFAQVLKLGLTFSELGLLHVRSCGYSFRFRESNAGLCLKCLKQFCVCVRITKVKMSTV